MVRLNYEKRKSSGLKLGQIIAKDLRKHVASFFSKPANKRETTSLEIRLPGKDLTDDGFREAAAGLEEAIRPDNDRSCHRLEEINLSKNSLTTASLVRLAPIIRLARFDLKDIDLSHNDIKITTEEEASQWETFLGSFKDCRVLRRIDLSHNDLSNPRVFEILARVYSQQMPVDSNELELLEEVDGTIDEGDEDLEVLDKKSESLNILGRKESKATSSLEVDSPALATATVLQRRCGLRSVPYLILCETKMNDYGALHLSYIVAQHYFPQQLMARLKPSTEAKQLEEYHTSNHCWGLVYAPNDTLQSGYKVLEQAETVRQRLLHINDLDYYDSQSSYALIEATPAGSGLRRNSSLSSSTVPHRRGSNMSSDSGNSSSPVPYKKDAPSQLESSRRKLQRETIEQLGPCKVQLWCATLRLLWLSRELLLRPTRGETHPDLRLSSQEMSTKLANPKYTGSSSAIGLRESLKHTENINFNPSNFPQLPTLHTRQLPKPQSPLSSLITNIPRGSSRSLTPAWKPVQVVNPQMAKATAIVMKEKSFKDHSMPANLLEKTWHRIIADAAGVDGVLSLEQQRAVISYAKDRSTLKHEQARAGMSESVQIWHLLEAVGCLTYPMRM